jgi:UDP-N-acetylmuramate dehydrogenase
MTPQTDVALAPLCTLGVGGPARWFVDAGNESTITAALAWAESAGATVQILGGGSNVVIADEGIDGLVIRIDVRGVDQVQRDGRTVHAVGAGEPWDEFVAATVRDDRAGLECLSGIPGLAGGTPVQNVGAYGQDVSGSIVRVRIIDRASREALWLTNAECQFGYRSSRFKREDADRYIVTAVEFGLTDGGAPTVQYADVVTFLRESGNEQPSLADVRSAVLTIRRRKGMVIEPGHAAVRSCGSFFVNPVVTRERLQRVRLVTDVATVPFYDVDAALVKIPAAFLIERAGFPRGTTAGPVGISPYQAQAIINLGGASARDVLALAVAVKRAVWDVFGISIVPEPVFLGFHASPELRFLLTPVGSH